MQRRWYRPVCTENRCRIIEAFKNGTDYVAVARELGFRHTTAWSVFAKWQRTGETAARPIGGSRHFKVDDAMRDMLLMIIESDPYSPFLNPIENMFSVFKVDFK